MRNASGASSSAKDLSRYIIRNKESYYRLLQEVRTHENWEPWIRYILKGVEETAEERLSLVKKIGREKIYQNKRLYDLIR